MGELPWVQRAIVVVDLVESVRLMQADPDGVIERWRRFERQARAVVARVPSGRIVKNLGDGMLIEFTDARDAVATALSLDALLEPDNAGRAAADQMWLRIGVHLGSVKVDERDIYGPDVNLAARLSASAQPRDVVASAALCESLVAGLDAEFEDLGDLYLKHLPSPVRGYRLRQPGSSPRPAALAADRGGLKPGVAVIPFRSSSPDPAFAAVGHALADDINAALSRSSDLRVISRLSTAAFSSGRWPMAEIREQLGAVYVLSGAYHVIGGRVRLTVELCDARDERVLWATGLNATLDEIFHSQDRLVPEIVSQLGRQVLAAELERTGRIPIPSLEGYTLYLGGVGLLNRLTSTDFERARELLQHVSERQPRAAAPHAMLAKWHVLRIIQGWSDDALRDGGMARAAAHRAIDLDDHEAFALTADGLVSVLVDADLEAGGRRYAQALERNPNEPYAWALTSGLKTYLDDPAAAEHAAERALSLSPLDPARFLFESYLAFAKLGASKYDEAAHWAQSSLRLNALHGASLRLLIMALSLAGRAEEARAAVQRLRVLDPQSTVSRFIGRYPVKDSARLALYASALRDAGLPA